MHNPPLRTWSALQAHLPLTQSEPETVQSSFALQDSASVVVIQQA
jgi:hypothetical protein